MGMFDKYNTNFEPMSEEATAAITKQMAQRMQPGVHAVTLKEFALQKQTDGTEHVFKFNQKDFLWGSLSIIFVNADKEEHRHNLMVPLANTDKQRIIFNGQNAPYMLRQFKTLSDILGLSLEKLQEAITKSDCAVLQDIVGLSCYLHLSWKKDELHLQYNREEKVHYLHDAEGNLAHNEPFAIPKEGKYEDRYSEPIAVAHSMSKKLSNNMESTMEQDEHDNTGYGIKVMEFLKPKAKPTLGGFAALKKNPIAKKPDPVVDGETEAE